MKTMKKVVALGIAAVMTLSLAACGGGGKDDKVGDDYNGGPWEPNRNFNDMSILFLSFI